MTLQSSSDQSRATLKRIAIVTDAVYANTPTGTVSLDGINGDDQWRRYQLQGHEYRIYGRLRDSADSSRGAPLTLVKLVPLPDYVGLIHGLRKYRDISRVVRSALELDDAVILRMPGLIGVIIYPLLRKRKVPYVVEVVGDIADLYANSPGILSRLQKPLITRMTKNIIGNARAARYVTQTSLQQRYPNSKVMRGVSNVQVPDDVFVSGSRTMPQVPKTYKLLCVGTQDHDYKGHDVAIHAMKLLSESGVNVELSLVGSGRLSSSLKHLAAQLGVADRVHFVGQLPKTEVFEQYRSHHLLLQPSRTEGLPRTVIEAMSQALPVVGSNVSGLPELLNHDFMVPPNEPRLLAEKISSILEPKVWESESARSLAASQDYRYSILSDRFREWIEVIRSSFSSPLGGTSGTTPQMR